MLAALLICNVIASNWCMTIADLVIWQLFGGNTVSNGSQGHQQRLHAEWLRQGIPIQFDGTHMYVQDSMVTDCFNTYT